MDVAELPLCSWSFWTAYLWHVVDRDYIAVIIHVRSCACTQHRPVELHYCTSLHLRASSPPSSNDDSHSLDVIGLPIWSSDSFVSVCHVTHRSYRATMGFQFVPQNDRIDSEARRLIRSHVMIGKNVGKTRRPGERTKASTYSDRLVPWSKTNVHNNGVSITARPGGDELSISFSTFPCKIKAHEKRLLHECM